MVLYVKGKLLNADFVLRVVCKRKRSDPPLNFTFRVIFDHMRLRRRAFITLVEQFQLFCIFLAVF